MEMLGPRTHSALPRCLRGCFPRHGVHGDTLDGEWESAALYAEAAQCWETD